MKQPPVKYAGFWRRLSAFLLDSALFLSILLPILYLIYGRDYLLWLASDQSVLSSYGVIDFLLRKVLAFVLIVFFWAQWSATPGKLMLDCKVVDAQTLQPIHWRKAALRCAAYLISMLPLYLGFIWIAWDKRKQGLHDKLAGTLVLYHADDYADKTLPELMEQLR